MDKVKNDKQRKALEKDLRAFLKHNKGLIVLCEDGKETNNTYPLPVTQERDASSPADWLNGIMFGWCLRGQKTELKLILK